MCGCMQSIETESVSGATGANSPTKLPTDRSQAISASLLERSSIDIKKTLTAAMPRTAVRRGGFKVTHPKNPWPSSQQHDAKLAFMTYLRSLM